MASTNVSQHFRFRGPIPRGYLKSRTLMTLIAATFLLGYSHISDIINSHVGVNKQKVEHCKPWLGMEPIKLSR